MSSSSTSSSSKEADILRRQRLLAAQLGNRRPSHAQNPAPRSSSVGSSARPGSQQLGSAAGSGGGNSTRPPSSSSSFSFSNGKAVRSGSSGAAATATTSTASAATRPAPSSRHPPPPPEQFSSTGGKGAPSASRQKPPPPLPPRPPPKLNPSYIIELEECEVSAPSLPPGDAKAAGVSKTGEASAAAPTALKRPTAKKKRSAASIATSSSPLDAKTPAPSRAEADPTLIYRRSDDASASSSPPVKRRTLSATAGGAPALSSSSSASAAQPAVPAAASTLARLIPGLAAGGLPLPASGRDDAAAGYPVIQPDDFWKHLREWDFCTYYYNSVMADTTGNGNTGAMDSTSTLKPLPDTFLNHRHYAAAWAPLVLAECRAQILQEWTSSAGGGRNLDAQGVLVNVESTHSRVRASHHHRHHHYATGTMMDESETAGHVLLTVPKHAKRGPPASFQNGEVCLLIQSQHLHVLSDLSRGIRTVPPLPGRDVGDYSGISLIGHTESSRSDLQGLVLKVSKRRWARAGQKEMVVLRLGSNVTALREFTALAKVETLPMKKYLFGQHLEGDDRRRAARKLSRHQSAEALLKKMGGTSALGEGFIKYATDKFNASQLAAIAASANEYGEGGFTLIKGPPGTGKTTTLVAVLNSLHIRQYNKYYDEVRRIASAPTGARQAALELARRAKPRLLVTAPSNAAVDNIVLKIMQDGFVDGKGQRYNPSMIRVGVGQGAAVSDVSLETKVDAIFAEYLDVGKLDLAIIGFKSEQSRITKDIARLRRRCAAIVAACPYPLGQTWEIRIDEQSDETPRVYFVNHKEKMITYECPPPPEPGEAQFEATSMPEHRLYMGRIIKLVETFFHVKSELERCAIVKSSTEAGANQLEIRQSLELHVLNSVHMIMTTLGTAGNRTLEGTDKFEVVVVDEAAQSVEPSILSSLQLGSRHAVLVGDPQQLPATIFNVSGRKSKYDRSLFQRLEEAGQPVYMLNEQYRMHPKISHFPRTIFYGGNLLDGPNVRNAGYGNPLRAMVCNALPKFSPFMILDLDSKEERGGTSLSNAAEAHLALYLYVQLKQVSRGLSSQSRVAVITPYAQQSKVLRQVFESALGPRYANSVEINTVDAFQGREASIVIFSAVRAAGSHGIGFLSDVRRMNVALTRARHFLFVIARCESIVVNPYWKDLVLHARETNAVASVPLSKVGRSNYDFGALKEWNLETTKPSDPRMRHRSS